MQTHTHTHTYTHTHTHTHTQTHTHTHTYIQILIYILECYDFHLLSVYWGQDSVDSKLTFEKSLIDYCDNYNYHIINIGFVVVFFNQKGFFLFFFYPIKFYNIQNLLLFFNFYIRHKILLNPNVSKG